jgi:hypothetical protein
MSIAMILLAGEQPAPNLLPTRHLQPDAAVLVYTDRTRRVAENLRALLEPGCRCWLCQVHPYRIHEIQQELSAFLATTVADHSLVFNLTGGTKAMALGAFRVARMQNSPFVYFQTEGSRSLLYRYAVEGDKVVLQATDELPVTISLDDYLRIYLGTYTCEEPRTDFEQQVVNVLRSTPGIAEVVTGLRPQGLEAQEVDFLVRCGNQVGIGEVKTKGAKRGIDQLNAVAEQRYLGTYLRKFLVSGKPVDRNNKNLAQAYRIEVIELLSYGESGMLNANDRQKLAETVRRRLGGQ